MRKKLLFFFMLFQIVTYGQSISSFSPKSGKSGTSVTITGTGFNSTLSSNIVYLSGIKCAVTAASTTSLTVTIPSGGVTGKFMYSNSGTAKVCQSGVPFIMAYNAIPAANTYNCSTSTLIATSNTITTPGPATLASSVNITDVDEDGKPDIMSSYGQYTPYSTLLLENIYVQVSKNASSAAASVTAGNFSTSNIFYYNNSTDPAYSYYPKWLHLKDLNGDGRLDVTMLASGQTVNNKILRNAGTSISTGNYPAQAQTGFLTNTETNGDWLDINRNGSLDFIGSYGFQSYAQNDRLKLFANTSSGNTLGLATATYSASASANQQIKPSTDNIAWSIVKTIDFDNDGDEDVLLISRNATNTTSSNCRVYLLKNNGNNSVSESNFTLTGVLADLGAFSSVSVTDVSFADFDNDGLYDVALLLNGNNVKIFRNTSSGGNISLDTPVSFTNGNTINQSLSINDFDNDGKADILIAGKGGVKLIQNLTTGSTLSFGNEVNLKTWTYFGIPSIQVCDLNADGIPELVGVEDTALNSNSYRNLVVYSYILPPTITVNSNLSNFTSCGGFASAAQTFTVAGTNLTANVTVGALSGFEYSTNGTTYSTTLSLAPTSGTLATTTVYVRSASTATGTLSGNIVVTSTTCGAPTINVAANRAVTASIDYQPSALTNTCLNSDPQTLYVSTTGTNLTYQWYVNTTNSTVGATAISGATNDYYDVPTNVAGTKYYYVVVSASCGQMVSTINSQLVGSSPAAKLTSINIPSSVCLNTPTVASIVTSGSSQNWWQYSTNNINWTYSSTFGSSYTIPTNVVGTRYYRVRMNGACGGYVFTDSYSVTVKNILPGTIAATNSTLCSGQSTSIAITGNVGTIQWEVSSNGTSNWTAISGATASSLNTGILNNTRYYRAKVSNNGCVVYSNTQTITVNPLLGYLGAISGTSNVTGLSSTTYSVPAVTNATNYVWLLPVGMTISSSTGNQITVDISSSFIGGVLSVKATNSCGESIVRTKNIAINPAIATISMSGPRNICVNTTPTATYSVNAIAGCTYNWSVPAGVSLTSSSNNSIDVSFDVSFVQGTISVTITNGSGNVVATSSTLIGTLATPGSISGPSNLCGNTTATYYIPSVTDATSYSWIVPNGMTIIGDASSNTINVSISGTVNGNIRVQAIGDCGVSPYNYLNVASTQMPGAITGPTSVCGATVNATSTSGSVNSSLNSQSTYSVDAVVGATSYTWSVPTGATIISGQGTKSIVVNYNFSTFVPGQIAVTANSSCGSSAPRAINITVASASISGPTSICDLTTATYSVPSDSGSAFSWTIPSWMSLTAGSLTSNSITVDFSGPICDIGVIAVDVTSLCGPVNTSTLNVSCNKYTKIQNSQANSVAIINVPIYANSVAGATGYQFRIKDGTTIVATLNKPNRWFTFSEINNIAFGKTYSVEVAVKTATTSYTTYGFGCTTKISLQNSQIQASQCGTTMAINLPIYADAVTGATGYRFEISDASTGTVIATLNKSNRYFYLNEVANLSFGTTYSIRVAPRNTNETTYGSYGTSCTITTPITKIQASQCGITIANYLPIYADAIVGATGYRFEISDATSGTIITTLNKPSRYFYLNEIAGSAFGTSYAVKVAPRNPDGVTYGSYGQSCTISRLPFPTSKLQNSQCDYTVASNTELIYADIVQGATQYRFRMVNDNLGYDFYLEKPVNNFNLTMTLGVEPSTTYSVYVAVYVSGEWGPFGKVCSITSPASTARTSNSNLVSSQIEFNANAYPNPFADNFKLELNSSSEDAIQIKVYDMLGQIIEVKNTTSDFIKTLEIGEKYPSGVYNVIISQGEFTKTLRVIKR